MNINTIHIKNLQANKTQEGSVDMTVELRQGIIKKIAVGDKVDWILINDSLKRR